MCKNRHLGDALCLSCFRYGPQLELTQLDVALAGQSLALEAHVLGSAHDHHPAELLAEALPSRLVGRREVGDAGKGGVEEGAWAKRWKVDVSHRFLLIFERFR